MTSKFPVKTDCFCPKCSSFWAILSVSPVIKRVCSWCKKEKKEHQGQRSVRTKTVHRIVESLSQVGITRTCDHCGNEIKDGSELYILAEPDEDVCRNCAIKIMQSVDTKITGRIQIIGRSQEDNAKKQNGKD